MTRTLRFSARFLGKRSPRTRQLRLSPDTESGDNSGEQRAENSEPQPRAMSSILFLPVFFSLSRYTYRLKKQRTKNPIKILGNRSTQHTARCWHKWLQSQPWETEAGSSQSKACFRKTNKQTNTITKTKTQPALTP